MINGMNERHSCRASARACEKPSAYRNRMNEFLTRFQCPYFRNAVSASSAESSSPEMLMVSGTRVEVPIESSSNRSRSGRRRLRYTDDERPRFDGRVDAATLAD